MERVGARSSRIVARWPTTVNIALVGKYVQLPDAYLSVNEALDARRHLPRPQGERALGRRGERSRPRRSTDPREDGRHPRAGRLRHPRHRGQDPRGLLRAREQGPVLRHLPRHAGRGRRVRAQRRRAGRTRTPAEFDPVTAAPGHRPHARPARRADMGGTMRLGTYPCKVVAGHEGLRRRTARSSSTSATVTATRSTTRTASGSPMPVYGHQRAVSRRASSSRWSSCRTTRGSSATRGTPSSRAARRGLRRSSATSSARRWRTRTRPRD